jgi:hypothetical protein
LELKKEDNFLYVCILDIELTRKAITEKKLSLEVKKIENFQYKLINSIKYFQSHKMENTKPLIKSLFFFCVAVKI